MKAALLVEFNEPFAVEDIDYHDPGPGRVLLRTGASPFCSTDVVNWRGQLDKRGVHIHAVGTVGIKHLLYSRLSADADKDLEHRWLRFSHELPDEYFGGLVAEIYNPAKNRFEKRRGAPRNEPLDTWVYAYAATHHPELRLHRRTKLEWEAAAERLTRKSEPPASASAPPSPATRTNVPRETLVQDVDDGFGSSEWSRRL